MVQRCHQTMKRCSHPVGGQRAASRVGILATLAASALLTCSAAVSVGDAQLGGFFSQGYLHSSGTNYPVDTRGGTADFREMALNVSMPVGARLRLGAQAFAQKLGKYGDDKVILDWAVADYNVSTELGIRAGRVKLPGGLYNESLDLDLTRPFIFLPQAIYDVRLRDFNASFDGGMLYGAPDLGRYGGIEYKAFYGRSRIRTEATSGVSDYFRNSGLFTEPEKAEMDALWGGALVWSTPVSGLRLSATLSQMDGVQVSGPFAFMPVTTAVIELGGWKRWVLSTEYLVGDWTFAAEWKTEGGTATVSNAAIGMRDSSRSTMDGYYVSVARRLGDRVEVGGYVGRATGNTAQAGRTDSQDDYALSVRFDLNENVLFKVEGHLIDGTSQVFHVPGVENPNPEKNFGLFAAKVTFSF